MQTWQWRAEVPTRMCCVCSARCALNSDQWSVLEVGAARREAWWGLLRLGSHVNEILDLRQGQQQRFFRLFSRCLLSLLLLHFSLSFRPCSIVLPFPSHSPFPCIWTTEANLKGKPGQHFIYLFIFLNQLPLCTRSPTMPHVSSSVNFEKQSQN